MAPSGLRKPSAPGDFVFVRDEPAAGLRPTANAGIQPTLRFAEGCSPASPSGVQQAAEEGTQIPEQGESPASEARAEPVEPQPRLIWIVIDDLLEGLAAVYAAAMGGRDICADRVDRARPVVNAQIVTCLDAVRARFAEDSEQDGQTEAPKEDGTDGSRDQQSSVSAAPRVQRRAGNAST